MGLASDKTPTNPLLARGGLFVNRSLKADAFRYGLAVVSTLIATGVRWGLERYLGEDVPFLTYFPAVFVTALLAGFGPALVTVAFSGLIATFFIIPPAGHPLPHELANWLALALFCFFGVGTAFLSEGMRRKSEQVHQEWERFSVTLSSVGDGVIVTDELGRVMFLNPVAETLTGWTLAEAQGQPLEFVFSVVNEKTGAPAENPVSQALKLGAIVGLANHTILIAKDGTRRAIDDSAAPLRDRSGDIIGVVLVFRDVSHTRAAQLERARLAALVGSSEDAILGLTLDGVITDWNEGAERLFGYLAEEIAGQSIFSTIVPQGGQQEVCDVLGRIRQGEAGQHYETLRKCKDGRLIPVSIHVSPIQDADGDVIGASAIDRDISLLWETERRRNARLAVTQILAQERSIEKALAEILAAMCSALEWDVGCLWRVQSDENVLRCQEFWQKPSQNVQAFRTVTLEAEFSREQSLPGRVWSRSEPLWISDVVLDPTFLRASEAEVSGLHGGFACPVAIDDQFLGVIEFFSHEIQAPDEDLLEMMATLGGQIGQFIERRETEQKHRRKEQELDDFFENAAVGLHWVEPDGTILRVNQAELDLLGYVKEEYVGRSIREFHADPPVIEDILSRLAAGEQLRDYEARMRCKDGTIKQVLIDSNGLWEDGKFIHSRCFTRDISKRKRMEDSLRFLAEASKSLATLVDYRSTLQKVAYLAVPSFADWCAVDMLDEGGTLQRLAVAHQDPDQVHLAEEIFRRYPPRPDTCVGVMKVLRTGEPDLVTQIDHDMLAKAAQSEEHLRLLQQLHLQSFLCVPLAGKDRVLGVMSFVFSDSGRRYKAEDLSLAEDLAHRAVIAVENARLYQELKVADRRKDEFLAMLAHELRNPLAPICSGLDILAMDESDGHLETIKLMQDQVEHVVRLVDDLLDMSRIMRGRIELRKEPVELSMLVQRSVATVQPLVEGLHQKLIVSLPEEPLWLNADPVRIVQVFENLLNNASKYTETEGRIELTAERQDGQVVVKVHDTGVGIEPDLLPHVFDLFTQSARSLDRAQGGLGIGLTLVKRLVEFHGGTVSAESEGSGRGSTFLVQLPLTKKTSKPEKPAKPPPVSVPRKVLVVDDNVGAARMLSKLVVKLGEHAVEIAHDGPSALEKIKQFQPDIVLLDIGLPGLDGYQVAREVRSDPQFDHTLLVALTGYGQKEDRLKSKEAGIDEHLVKPPAIDQVRGVFAHSKLNAAGPPQIAVSSTSQTFQSEPSNPETSLPEENVPAAEPPESAPLDLRQFKHDLGNVAYVLSLVGEMFLNPNLDAELAGQARTAVEQEVTTLHRLMECLQNKIDKEQTANHD